jgi:V/A-type H+-transporting ATPase subunit I
MSLHPVPARWFEVLVARDDTVKALETLARTDAVELELRVDADAPQVLPDFERQMEAYRHLARQCEAYWPRHRIRPSALTAAPSQTLRDALQQLEQWCAEADPAIQSCERLKAEHSDLLLWRELLASLEGSEIDFEAFAAGGPALERAVFVAPVLAEPPQVPGGLVVQSVRGEAHAFHIALGPALDLQLFEHGVKAAGGRRLVLLSWLAFTSEESLRRVQRRLTRIAAEQAAEDRVLHGLDDKYRLRDILGDILLLDWFVQHMRACPGTENFCWLTGWTSDLRGKLLEGALRRAGVRAVVRFAPAPEDAVAPLVMLNPWWAKPFEIFPKLMGMPAAHEVDPSFMLAIVVPLLFGYMFGDIGQGLVLAGLGLTVSRRWREAAVLVPCGLSATLFGWAFGSVFGIEGVVDPLWIRPLEQPMLALGVPLVAGAGLMLLGLLLGGLEAYGRGGLVRWAWADGAVVALYAAALLSLAYPPALMLVLPSLFWYLAGSVRLRPKQRLRGLLEAMARLLESGMQLAVNTLSFARVGAFALAHAGLSVAMVSLAEAAGGSVGRWAVIIVGNLTILLLEGLVVSIQTTRLILFEFFIRFLRAEGRIFKSIAAPGVVQGDSHGTTS